MKSLRPKLSVQGPWITHVIARLGHSPGSPDQRGCWGDREAQMAFVRISVVEWLRREVALCRTDDRQVHLSRTFWFHDDPVEEEGMSP